MSAAVADNPQRRRYEIHIDGEVAGFVTYRRQPDQIEFVHTEIGDRFEGQGLGGKLVAFALDDARANGLTVLPSCPFVKDYIRRHPGYGDLEQKR
jgi:predicted GNAT family acetyltransferase